MTIRRRLAIALSAGLLAGCGHESPWPASTSVTPTSPTAPIPAANPPPLLPTAQANYQGDATVISNAGGAGCGWGRAVGETRQGVFWNITISGDTVALDEDMLNWPTDHVPFRGTLSGRRFTAAYSQGDDYLRYVCQFKGGTLTGSFSDDLSSFDVMETLEWGPPENRTTVQRRWSGTRR